MGVYIRGMEMPKGCAFCRIGKRNGKKMVCPLCDEKWDIHDPMSADHKLDNCPLIPVPPHGDLIDRDALAEDGWVLTKQVMRMGGHAIHELPLKNPTIPVIIPTEEGET